MWILTVEKGGRVTLPKDLLEVTGWKVGDTLLFQSANDGAIVVSRVKRAKSLSSRKVPLSNVEGQE